MKTKGIGAIVLGVFLCGCETHKEPRLGEPLAELTPEQLAQFEQGKKVFQRVFTPEDGLGPLFNANSCAECHEQPVVGGVGDEIEVQATRFHTNCTCDPLLQEGGPVIEQHATPLLQAKGIQKAQIPPGADVGRRSTPPLFGLGLVDAIPEATVLAGDRQAGSTAGGSHGHANRTVDGKVGRFGRKAAVATLFDFNAAAFLQEIGITTPLEPAEKTINGAPLPAGTDPAPDPEISLEDIERVTAFLRFLAPPPEQAFTNYHDRVLARHGEKLFMQLGCAVCHVPKMQTGPSEIKALDRKCVRLYSDLLLHDMGSNSTDICFQQARPSEFRSEMLMGLRFREHFLHDASARTVREAIERHGGEAQRSRDRFMSLSHHEQAALLKFLQKL